MQSAYRPFSHLALLLIALALGGCGVDTAIDEYLGVEPTPEVGSFPTPPGSYGVETKFARKDRSGTVSNSGFVGAGVDLAVGDSESNETARGFYAFRIDDLGSVDIEKAVLSTSQFVITGSPYGDLGAQILVERVHLNGPLDATDFAKPGTAVGPFGGPSVGAHAIDVTEALEAAIQDGRTYLELRFRFPTDTDGDRRGDFVNLADPENRAGTSTRPQLVIDYRTR